MEIFILDNKFKSLYNLDVFESLIWTERYRGYGDFEFYTPVNQAILQIVSTIQEKMVSNLDCYAWLKESGTVMVIEELEIKTDVETGNHLIMSGRGLESLLERRIIWEQTILNGKLQNEVKRLITDAIIDPKIFNRKVSNFVFLVSDNEYIKSLFIKAQYTGDNLYEVILSICEAYDLGFDVYLGLNNEIIFSLTRGEDRSYDQEKNQYVIFSPNYENIANSDYLESSKTLKNVALVAGEGEGTDRITKIVGSGEGLSRRELYVDARDIQQEDAGGGYSETTNSSGGTTVYIETNNPPTEDYYALLQQRGVEKLAENKYTKTFTGEVEALKTFVYGKDFFKGDIVQVVNEYGMESKVRVSEFVRTQDTDGYKTYPTFEVVA